MTTTDRPPGAADDHPRRRSRAMASGPAADVADGQPVLPADGVPPPTSRRAARLAAARTDAGSEPTVTGRSAYGAYVSPGSGYSIAPQTGPVLDLEALARSGPGSHQAGGPPPGTRTIGDLQVGPATTPIRRRRPVSLPESFEVPDEPVLDIEPEQATMPVRTQSRSPKTGTMRVRGRVPKPGDGGHPMAAPPVVSAPPTGAMPFGGANPTGPALTGAVPTGAPSGPVPTRAAPSGPVPTGAVPSTAPPTGAISLPDDVPTGLLRRTPPSGFADPEQAARASDGPHAGDSQAEPVVERTEHLARTEPAPSRRSRRRAAEPPNAPDQPSDHAPSAQAGQPGVEVAPDTGPAAVQPRRSRTGRNLPIAIAVGVLMAGVVLASLLFRKEAFVAVVCLASVVAVWELATALAAKNITVPVVPLAVGSVGMLVSAFVAGEDGLLVSFALTSFGVLLWRIIDGAQDAARDVAASVFAAAYVPFLAGFTMLMLAAPDGAMRIIVFILVVVASDTGGYTAGVLFGRHPMAPTVSPHKSWEGFLGSAVACMVAGSLGVFFLLHGVWYAGVAAGAAAVVTATVGDLSESLLKRDLGIKDMGHLLPGHGGMLDRIDSLLLTAPVVYVLLSLLVPLP